MKGKIHEFLRSLWHFLNLEINAGIHIEGRERERRKEKELETGTATKREKMNKYVLSAYYVAGTSPGGQTDDHMVENRLDIIFFTEVKYYRSYSCGYKIHECEGPGSDQLSQE